MSLIFLLALFLILLALFWEPLVTLTYSHFGNQQSQSESDNQSKTDSSQRNWADRSYYQILYQNHQLMKQRAKRGMQAKWEPVPTIGVAELAKAEDPREKFRKLTKNFTCPLVVKGFLKGSKACQKWSLDYFEKHYGKARLPIITDGSLENQKKYLAKMKSDYQMMKLGDHIQKIRQNKKSYLNNVSRIFGLHPELLDDMELDNITKYTGINVKDGNNVTHMFLGGQGTGSSLHSSITGNFFYNIKGQKRWILIHPKYSKYLLPNISATGLFVVSQLDLLNSQSLMPPLPYYDFTLEEGDLFFNPPWWWHAVENRTPYTIGCANRFSNFWVGFKNNPLYTMVFFSHPVSNYQDFNFSNKKEANLNFDRALLRDILRKSKKEAL